MTRTEIIASAIANARGARRGMPHIENVLDLLPDSVREDVLDDAAAVEKALTTEIPMRPTEEIQRAHDILTAVLLDEVPLDLDEEWRRGINISVGALCWALRHDHNPAFADNLKAIEEAAAALGFGLVKSDRLQSRADAAAGTPDLSGFGMPPELVRRPG